MKFTKKLTAVVVTLCLILPVFALTPAYAADVFSDVFESDWFYEDVFFCYGEELMVGTSGNTFDPDGNFSRAMVVTTLYRLSGEPEVNDAELIFEDVPYDSWYTDAVAWAYEKNIAYGISDVCFAPEKDVTREELATFIYRYIVAEDLRISLVIDMPDLFYDGKDIAKYAALPVSALYRAEIIKGKPGNMFEPSACATRAEGAALLNRVVTLAPKQEYTLLEKHGIKIADVYMHVPSMLGSRAKIVYLFECDVNPDWVITPRLIDDVTFAISDATGPDCIWFDVDNKNYDNYMRFDLLLDYSWWWEEFEIDSCIVEFTVEIDGEKETYISYLSFEPVY